MSIQSNRRRVKRQHEKQKKLGLCQTLYCKNKPAKDRKTCLMHLKEGRERHIKNKLKNKNKWLN